LFAPSNWLERGEFVRLFTGIYFDIKLRYVEISHAV